MTVRRLATVSVIAIVFAAGFTLGNFFQPWGVVNAQAGRRVYELRTYTSPDGRLDDLQARFRNHTVKLFEKHGITSIGYFVPQDAPQSQNTLIYCWRTRIANRPSRTGRRFRRTPTGRQPSRNRRRTARCRRRCSRCSWIPSISRS